MGSLVAIHQPNFLPWLGYFNKIHRADVFIILDNVQFPQTAAGTWVNRVKIALNSKEYWLTIPIDRSFHGVKLCCEIKVDKTQAWQKKLIKTIQNNYAKAPFFKEIFPLFESTIQDTTENLIDINYAFIFKLLERFNINSAKIKLASTLSANGNGTDLLISLVKAAGGDGYLCGGGATGYQEDDAFAQQNLQLVYQHFTHPIYKQYNTKEFIPGLSILDVLMNCGFMQTAELIKCNHSINYDEKAIAI